MMRLFFPRGGAYFPVSLNLGLLLIKAMSHKVSTTSKMQQNGFVPVSDPGP